MHTFEIAELQDDEKTESHREHLATDFCDEAGHSQNILMWDDTHLIERDDLTSFESFCSSGGAGRALQDAH